MASMMPQFAQTTPSLNLTAPTKNSKETIEQIELDPKVADKINMQCKNIIQEYEEMHNLDVCIYLFFILKYYLVVCKKNVY